MGPGGGTGRQLVAIQAAGFQIEEPGGARDLPQGNTHSAHNTRLSDATRPGPAGGGSPAGGLQAGRRVDRIIPRPMSVPGSSPEGDQHAEKPLTENSSGFFACR